MTVATRPATKPAQRPRQSDLHETLVSAQEVVRLARFAADTGCTTAELASPAGTSLNLASVFDAMRRRGYAVSEPKKPQQQLQLSRGLVLWTVDISINGTSATMAFYTAAPQK